MSILYRLGAALGLGLLSFRPQDSIKELMNCILQALNAKTAARCGPPLLLSEGLFCAFGWLIADGSHFVKPA